ncbi:MAG: methyl-accepting chemotaxis protein [Pseudomonadota bacterium]|nr:methyl-accepting chemotaxis protein [Pseudomonadota bacterium]
MIPISATGIQKTFRDSAILIAKTDPDGKLIQVNEDFMELTGFTEEEVMNQPPLFHPDMPQAVIVHLWVTVNRGKLWNGMIKNLCRNGDHYWSETNVTPIFHDKKITGFLFVFAMPTREQIGQAEEHYARIPRNARRLPESILSRLLNMSIMKWTMTGCFFGVFMPVITYRLGGGFAGASMVALLECFATYLFWKVTVFNQIEKLRTTMMTIQGSGNLKLQIQSRFDNELGQIEKAFNALLITLHGIVREVDGNAGNLAVSAAQLASVTENVRENSQGQASAIIHVTEATRAIAEKIVSVSVLAKQVHEVSKDSLERSRFGNESLQGLVQNMLNLIESINEMVLATQQFVRSTHEISDMTNEVSELAAKTNLLALNAAIEAARAGEAGRGFAVVADEVRDLAKKSAAAASQISSITNNIETKSITVETYMKTNLACLDASQSMLDDLQGVLKASMQAAEKACEGVTEVVKVANEQTHASSEISHNVKSISDVITKNTHAIGDIAIATEQLHQMSCKLQNAIGPFHHALET